MIFYQSSKVHVQVSYVLLSSFPSFDCFVDLRLFSRLVLALELGVKLHRRKGSDHGIIVIHVVILFRYIWLLLNLLQGWSTNHHLDDDCCERNDQKADHHQKHDNNYPQVVDLLLVSWRCAGASCVRAWSRGSWGCLEETGAEVSLIAPVAARNITAHARAVRSADCHTVRTQTSVASAERITVRASRTDVCWTAGPAVANGAADAHPSC